MGVIRNHIWTAVLLAVFTTQPTANASFLVNGDFEDLTDWGAVGAPVENAPAGWRDGNVDRLNAAGQQSGANAIGGAGASAYLPGDSRVPSVPVAERKEIIQRVDGTTGPVYQFAMDFATEDPGGANDRSLTFSTRDGGNNAIRTTFRVNGDGDFQSFNGSAFVTVLPGAVVFDDDISVTPLVHRLIFTVDSNVGTYDLTIVDSNNGEHSVTGATIWRGTPPIGAGASAIELNTFNSLGDSLIDNVSLVNIPEPSTLVLLGMVGIAATVKMRSKGDIGRE